MDDDYWTRDRDFGGIVPMSLRRMKERAAAVRAASLHSSHGEREMAAAVMYLLDEIARLSVADSYARPTPDV